MSNVEVKWLSLPLLSVHDLGPYDSIRPPSIIVALFGGCLVAKADEPDSTFVSWGPRLTSYQHCGLHRPYWYMYCMSLARKKTLICMYFFLDLFAALLATFVFFPARLARLKTTRHHYFCFPYSQEEARLDFLTAPDGGGKKIVSAWVII